MPHLLSFGQTDKICLLFLKQLSLFGDWINGLEILNCVFVAKEALYLKVNRA